MIFRTDKPIVFSEATGMLWGVMWHDENGGLNRSYGFDNREQAEDFADGLQLVEAFDIQEFGQWLAAGNAVVNEEGSYSTQDAQYGNRIDGLEGLKHYYIKEFKRL